VATGLFALLDDIAAIAKVAAASLDDVGLQATKAGAKAAGIVIDDAAVTPRYVVGFAASREIPIIAKIAVGSLKNKLLFLTPAALALSAFAPWAITPLLMAGGAYLCFEGFEKVWESISPHAHEPGPDVAAPAPEDPAAYEAQMVRGAIKTDFILSAEIMAITLATMPEATLWMQLAVLIGVGVGITALVYGAVALLVKADDAGFALARSESGLVRALGLRLLGRGLVKAMPLVLGTLSIVGTAAMLWVGGGIVVHGLEGYGFATIGRAIHDAAAWAGARAPEGSAGAVSWFASATGSGLFGLALGALIAPVTHVVAKLRGGH
jgi:predicted DNA repair protein MutK